MSAATQARISLAELNAMSREQFTRHLGAVLEHSPQFAGRVFESRPFKSSESLHGAFVHAIECAPDTEQLALIRAHPDLANRLEHLTAESTQEQSSAGLDELSAGQLREFQRLNTAYRKRFEFPFIICARLNSRDAILASFESRLKNSREEELKTALGEVVKIAHIRLYDLIESEG